MTRWFLLMAAVIAAPQLVHATEQPRKPNIIVFLADDVGYCELGFQGCHDIPTPYIDSIAQNGVRFTQAYVAATYCSPSRAGLITGRYPTRFGHEFNQAAGGALAGLSVDEKTIADRLKALGYSTLCVGKWDLGADVKYLPTSRGFDEFFGATSSTPYFHPFAFVDTSKSQKIFEIKDDSFYTTDAFAARVVGWIDKHKNEPFFVYIPFNAAHIPWDAPQKYLDRFAHIKDEDRRGFAACVSAMDDAVGTILSAVKKIGRDENTLITFSSDNGGGELTARNGPLRGFKGMTLEGGVRVAHCMQWKGRLSPGCIYDHPIINLDILPTAVVAGGGEIDPDWHLDGVDLMPYLTGQNEGVPHETLYWRHSPQWAIRKGDWKLVVNRNDRNKSPSLYNLKVDIGETRDLAAVFPEKVKVLKADWDKWNAEQAAPLWPEAPIPTDRWLQSKRQLVP